MIKNRKTLSLFMVLAMAVLFLTGCFGGLTTTTVKPDGDVIEQETNEAAMFSQHQSEAWKAYYTAILSPAVIATITPKSGDVIKIHSQITPPTPVFTQHQNQWIHPTANVLKTAINIIGGGLVLKEIVGAMEGMNINNNGDGNVLVDKSTNVSSVHSEEGGVIEQLSDSKNDSHIEKADPIVVTNETVKVVEPNVVLVPTIIVRPEIVRQELQNEKL